ncbi:hypothetical protein KUV57_24885 [Epibacterium sp. DP7N7-1]|nr:hypothetical protein [Epibacterium sp. DP7N7-1]
MLGFTSSRVEAGAAVLQTLVVTIGIWVAITEYRSTERQAQRLVRQYTVDMVQLDLSTEVIQSRRDIYALLRRLDQPSSNSETPEASTKPNRSEIDLAYDLEIALIPEAKVLSAWSACVAHNICDAEFALAQICGRVRNLYRIHRFTADALDQSNNVDSYEYLIDQCGPAPD